MLYMRRLRGLKSLVHDAVDLTTDLVHEGSEATARTIRQVTDQVEPLTGPVQAVDAIRRFSTESVLGTIKLVNRTVQIVSDAGISLVEKVAGQVAELPEKGQGAAAAQLIPAVPMRSDVRKSAAFAIIGDAALGLINGAVGDHLHRHDNGLELEMVFRVRDYYVPLERAALVQVLPAPSKKVALFVHGLGTTEWSFCFAAEQYHGDPSANFGTLLERDLGYTPIWLRYNSGRHISENGRQLAAELDRLIAAYPVAIEELIIVGHSMGGLVARSACHYGQEQARRFIPLLRRVFCLGSPHRGAPLEKLGHIATKVLGAIDLPGTLIPARLLSGRSAGIKDLRHGALLDEDWADLAEVDPDALGEEGQREVPLLPHVRYHFVSATVTKDPEHPLGHIIGDLLVRVPSSSGPEIRTGTFTVETKRFSGVMHHQLQNHPSVYEVLRRACAGEADPPPTPKQAS